MAERVGFEPTVPVRARRISSAVHSTTLPPLRGAGALRRKEPSGQAGASSESDRGWQAPECLLATLSRITLGVMRQTDRLPASADLPAAPAIAHARFAIGDIVRHRMFDFRGVVFDVDPVFSNTDEWYDSIPEGIRPDRDQPFYHLLAENMEQSYVAYVSQQNLMADDSDEPVDHPAIDGLFNGYADGRYRLRREHRH